MHCHYAIRQGQVPGENPREGKGTEWNFPDAFSQSITSQLGVRSKEAVEVRVKESNAGVGSPTGMTFLCEKLSQHDHRSKSRPVRRAVATLSGNASAQSI